jgi:hypothetical protein
MDSNQTSIFRLRAARKGCEMRERTAVKVARFVPGREGKSNLSFLFNGKWKYFYRAVDSNGDTIDFMLSAKRDRKAVKRFFKKALSSNHN